MVEQEQQSIKPSKTLKFESFTHKGWSFHHSLYPMFDTKELDQISDVVGTMGMPEVFYGYNHFLVSCPDKDFLMEFSPAEALRLSAFKFQKEFFRDPKKEDDLAEEFKKKLELDSELKLNQVDMIPKLIEVKEAQFWKKKDTSKVKDFNQVEIISDWTYSTTYKGSVKYLSNHVERIKNETALELEVSEEVAKAQSGKFKIETPSTETIPLERLGRENPIIHFGEIFLYEDDLGDTGYTRCSVRFRVMDDCFYILHRYYLRVDEVVVRIFDTRIFKGFESNYFIREFQHKESTYDQLRNKGFKISSEWSLSKTQSDEVANELDMKKKVYDKVYI